MPASNRSSRLCAIVLAALTLVACTRRNPRYCDATTPCPEAGQRCDVATRQCLDTSAADASVAPEDMTRRCALSSECPDGAPVCESGLCRACAGPADEVSCAARPGKAPRCDIPTGRCVECLGPADCKVATRPVCAPMTGACRGCGADADCESRVCLDTGACVPPDDTIVLDNTQPGCKPTDMGTPDLGVSDGGVGPRSYCTIAEALANLNGVKYVRVVQSAIPYEGTIRLAGGTLTVVGPNVDNNVPAKATFRSDLSAAGARVTDGTLTLRGLAFDGAGVRSSPLQCSGAAAALVLRDVTVSGSGYGAVITESGCRLDADRVVLNLNGFGFDVGGPFQITDSIVSNHRGYGLLVGALAVGAVRFSTVAFNTRGPGLPSGVSVANGGSLAIEASIVVDNGHPAGGSQFLGAVALSDTVVGDDSIAGGTPGRPAFRGEPNGNFPADVHLALDPKSFACCIDKIDPARAGGSPLPKRDVDNTVRPKGPRHDIGAHEIQ